MKKLLLGFTFTAITFLAANAQTAAAAATTTTTTGTTTTMTTANTPAARIAAPVMNA